jgi:hypothetical protein
MLLYIVAGHVNLAAVVQTLQSTLRTKVPQQLFDRRTI